MGSDWFWNDWKLSQIHHLRVCVCVCVVWQISRSDASSFLEMLEKKNKPIQAPKIAPQTWGHQGGIPGPHDFHPSLDSTKRPPWYNSPTSIRQIHRGFFRWKLDVGMIPSWELTYPLPRHFWRWVSFSPGGICYFPGGYCWWQPEIRRENQLIW